MKKVSEVREQIHKVGRDTFQRKNIENLLVACGILEDDTQSKFKIGDVWETNIYGEKEIAKVTRIEGTQIWGLYNRRGKIDETETWMGEGDSSWTELLWREP